jgi:hypothetical protein
LLLQSSNIFTEEVLKLFIGKHFINEAENSLPVFLVKLLDEPHLLHGCLSFPTLARV